MTALSLSASISVNDVTVRYNNGHTAIYDVAFALQGGNHLCSCRRKWERKVQSLFSNPLTMVDTVTFSKSI